MPEGMSEASTKESSNESTIKNKRKNLRGKITRCIKRLNQGVEKEDKNLRRFQKEMEQLRKDFDIHSNYIVSYTTRQTQITMPWLNGRTT